MGFTVPGYSELSSLGISEMWQSAWGLLAAFVVIVAILTALTHDPARPFRPPLAGPVLAAYIFLFGIAFPLWYDAIYDNWG